MCRNIDFGYRQIVVRNGNGAKDGVLLVRTVQELLGHADVSTTMIYTHVLNRGARGVASLLEGLAK